MHYTRTFTLLILIVCVGISSAQDTCPTRIEDALDQVDRLCNETRRNQACYGNVYLEAELRTDYGFEIFANEGDIVNVAALSTLDLSPYDPDTGAWGVALMQLQANIPNTLPGQNVTFLLFGDVSLENVAEDGTDAPMQAFYLQTGIGDSPCAEAPESGLLVQTPAGVTDISFNINGVDVAVGSTVLFQVEAEDEMIVTTVEGTAGLRMDESWFPVLAGTRVRLPVDNRLRPSGMPDYPESYADTPLDRLPLRLLDREIEIERPLDEDTLERLRDRLRAGDVPCGIEGLPDCDESALFERFEGRIPAVDRWGDDLREGDLDIDIERECRLNPRRCPDYDDYDDDDDDDDSSDLTDRPSFTDPVRPDDDERDDDERDSWRQDDDGNWQTSDDDDDDDDAYEEENYYEGDADEGEEEEEGGGEED